MPVKLRLTRKGSKHNPHYRVVAADSRSPRDGRFIEILGHYDPGRFPESVTLNSERIALWLDKGAVPTPAVKKLMKVKGILSKTPVASTPGGDQNEGVA